MGKYSLENYSSYETNIVRPKQLINPSENEGRGQFNLLEYKWEELESVRGNYNIAQVREALANTPNPVLLIRYEIPSWLTGQTMECFTHLIRRVGSSLLEEKNLVGVVITTVEDRTLIWDAYLDAFETVPLLAPLEEEPLIRYLKVKGVSFGLMVTCNEANWIDCCEKFAELNLQNTWEQMPVILKITDKTLGPCIKRELMRWHAGFANLPMDIGYNITLRRLTYPKKISGNGGLPLRFWFVNTGSAPCYKEFELKIQLRQETDVYEFTLHTDRKAWKTGDFTHNEILSLPELREGIYSLTAGIFFQDNSPMNLDIQTPKRNSSELSHSVRKHSTIGLPTVCNGSKNAGTGYYELGTIEVYNKLTDDLLHAWDKFYPEGYYPLEDPKAPQAN